MSETIPLVKDILDLYPNTDLDAYVDSKMLEMHNSFLSQNDVNYEYTNEDIYNYIKFVNITCLDVDNYKHVVKYINKDNISFFDTLFSIYDISSELLPLLSYDIVVNSHIFNYLSNIGIKNIWINKNIKYIKRYDLKILDPYITFEKNGVKYYIVDNIVYSNHKKVNINNKQSLEIIHHICEMAIYGHLELIKYVINTLISAYKNAKKLFYSNDFSAELIFCKTIMYACEYDKLDIVVYMVGFLKSIDKIYIVSNGQYSLCKWIYKSFGSPSIFKYLLSDEELKRYINIHDGAIINSALFYSIKNGSVEMIDFLISKRIDINNEIKIFDVSHLNNSRRVNLNEKINLLSISSYFGSFESVKHLVKRGIDLLKYGEKAIQVLDNTYTNVELFKYITDIYIPMISGNFEKLKSFLITAIKTTNKHIVAYINNNYITIDYIMDNIKNIDELLDIAYESGQYKFIEDVIHKMFIKRGKILPRKTYISFDKILPMLDYNDEDEIIHFISFLYSNNVFIEEIDSVVETCILKGYVKVVIFIKDDLYNMSYENIIKCIRSSHSEKLCIHIINEMTKKHDFKNEELIEIITESVKKGYLNLVVKVNDKKLTDLPLNTLLIEACTIEHFEMVKYLIGLGADTNHDNALKIVITKCKNIEIIKYMIEWEVNIQKVLLYIINNINKLDEKRYFEIIEHIYDSKLVDINDNITHKLFKVTCHNKMYDISEYLLKVGLKVELCINVLYDAMDSNNEEIVKLITNYIISDVYISNEKFAYLCKCNYTYVVKYISKYVDIKSLSQSILLHVCKNENLELVVHLCESRHNKCLDSVNGINFRKNNDRPLRISAKYGYVDIVEYLVEMGADINVIDTKYYDKDLCKYLKDIKSDVKLQEQDVNYYSSDELSDDSLQ